MLRTNELPMIILAAWSTLTLHTSAHPIMTKMKHEIALHSYWHHLRWDISPKKVGMMIQILNSNVIYLLVAIHPLWSCNQQNLIPILCLNRCELISSPVWVRTIATSTTQILPDIKFAQTIQAYRYLQIISSYALTSWPPRPSTLPPFTMW